MKHDGLTFVRNSNFGFRMSNPEVDVNKHGEPVPFNYVSFVKIRDCELYERDGQTYYNAQGVTAIPVAHGGTYYGYGEWKKRKSERGVYVERTWVHEYWQCTVYLAKKGFVYTTSLKRLERPESVRSK